jgi:hypothetical protein
MFYYGFPVNINTTDTYVIALINPTNSGKTILIKTIQIARNQNNGSTVLFSIKSSGTISPGTQVTPTSTIKGGTSIATLYTTPSVTTTSSTRFLFAIGLNYSENSKFINLDLRYGITPGDNLFIVGDSTGSNTPCFVTIEWVEV